MGQFDQASPGSQGYRIKIYQVTYILYILGKRVYPRKEYVVYYTAL